MKTLIGNTQVFEDDTLIESRYILDGATTIQEAIDLSKSFTAYLEELQEEGFELTSIIHSGKGIASIYAEPMEDEMF